MCKYGDDDDDVDNGDKSWVLRFFPHRRGRGLRRIQDGDIQPTFYNNGIKGVGMRMSQDTSAVVLLAGG